MSANVRREDVLMRSQQQMLLDYYEATWPKLRKSFDIASGRFLAPHGGWALTMQDVIFPLALLWHEHGTARHHCKEVFDVVCRGGDALLAAQNETGQFEFVKLDGSRWGWCYMPWPMMHWLQTYALIRDALDAEREARWRQGLLLAYEGAAKEVRNEKVHNIHAWYAAGLVRMGQLCDRPAWVNQGREYMHAVADKQNPDGFWAEGFGPTTVYNIVYVHAVGLYYQWTGDDYVLPCLERATDFHMHFTYPDGSACETIDGRVKYHAHTNAQGGPGFLATSSGKRYFRHQLQCYLQAPPEHCSTDPRENDRRDLQNLADAYFMLDDVAADAAPRAIQEQPRYDALRCERAIVRRDGDWFYCLSGYITPPELRSGMSRVRWTMDRQAYLSIWQQQSGLIVGGGNSKHQPELATFEIRTGPLSLCQADRTTIRQDDGCDILRLEYADTIVELQLRVMENSGVELIASLIKQGASAKEVLGGFMLPSMAHRTVRTSHTTSDVKLNPKNVWGDAWEDEAGFVEWKQVRLDVPAHSYIRWPVYPFNPYSVDDTAPAEQAVALVGFTLSAERPQRRFMFSVLDQAI